MPARRLALLLPIALLVLSITGLWGCGGAKPTAAPPADPAPAPAAQGATDAAPTEPAPAPGPPPAAPPPPLRLVGQYPLPGDPLIDHFVLYFSEPIVEPRDANGAVLPAVATNPAITLNSITVTGNFLVAKIDPASLQRPAQYEVSFPTPLRSTAGATLAGDTPPVRLSVPDPAGAVASALTLDQRTDTELRLRLRFSVPMNIEALKPSLRVSDASGAEVNYTLAPIDGSPEVGLVLGKDVALPVSVNVFPGAPDASGTSPVRTAAAFSFPDAALATLKINRFQRIATGEPGYRFGLLPVPTLTPDALSKSLQVTDASGTALAVSAAAATPGNATTLQFDLPASATPPFRFVLPKGTLAANGLGSLAHDFVATYPAETPLELRGLAWRVDNDGNHVLEFAFSDTVSSRRLGQLLTLRPVGGGDAPKFDLGSSTQSTVMARLEGVLAEMRTLEVEIAAGLEGGDLLVLPAPIKQTVERQATPLNIDYADWESRGKDGAVLRVDLNQSLDVTSMQSAVRFEPPVSNISVSTSWTRGILIKGDFASETTYTLVVGKEAKNALGDSVVAEELTFPLNDSPKVSGAGFDFDDKFYYPRRANGLVPLQTRNVGEVTVHLSQLFASNIQVALAGLEDGKTWDDFEGRWAKTIASKKISTGNVLDKQVTTPLDLKELLPGDVKGVFGLRLEPGSNNYATKIVVWTDIGLLAHWIDDELVVFAHDLFTLAPLADARVTVWSGKNQQMASTKTDAQGFAVIKGMEKSLGQPSLVVAETANDYTFLRLAPRTDDVVPVKDTMPLFDRKGYDAFVYSDRGLYRPGETIHARWIARTNYGDALAAVPLQVEVINPRGAKLLGSTTTLSALGTGGLDIDTDRAWMTGKYTLNLRVPGKADVVGSLQVNLEDFVPNRIKTELSISGERWNAREDQKISVRAENLVGGPAADRTAKGSVILRKGSLTLADYPGYSFTNDADYLAEVLPLGEAKTGADGIATFNFNWPGSPRVSFPINAVVRGEVSELGGRAVSDTKNVTLLTTNKLLGVNVAKGTSPEQIEISVAAVQADGAPAEVSSVRVLLEREDWSYYVRRFSSYNEPKFTKTFAKVAAREVQLVNGRGSIALDLPEYSWGYFRVKVTSSTTPMIATQAFYKEWDGIQIADTPRPSLIKLVPSQASYNVGDTATIRIESPFDGRAVVVLQGDNFSRTMTTEVTQGAGEVSIPLDAALAPNVWVQTTVIHTAPKDRAQVYPYSSFATISLPVKEPARQLAVTLPGLPEEIRPAQELQVQIETRAADGTPASAEVTLAAVDEGIHGILGYADPDPWMHLQRERRADYRRAHYYDRVAYDFTPDAIGGDLAERLSKRSATIGDNWIKPVALWSGNVTTDAEGRATITLAVPEFNGQLRLVAVAAGATATGAASKQLYVRRPYILQTSLPRFVLPGDHFTARAVLSNHAGTAAKARVSWTTTGTITGGGGSQDVDLPQGQEVSVLASLAASTSIGQGAVGWKAEIVDPAGQVIDTLVQDLPLPVRPPAAYQSRDEYLVLGPGQSHTFENTFFVDDAQRDTTLTVGNDPALRISNALRSLVEYPHGCVEQTTSRCMPVYLFRKSTALMESTLAESERAEAMVKQGIRRLLSMQTSSGGLAYWPGASVPDAYGSVYALHFLTLVERDREIPLPSESLQSLRDYVRKIGDQTADQSQSGLYLRAYAHYVLALGGDAAALKQIARFDAIEIPRSARYLLAAALAVNTNDPARVAKYLADTPAADFTDFERGGTLNSNTRDAAVRLLALLQIGAPEAELQPLVEPLTRYLEKNNGYVTQEAAFVCVALGSYLNRTKNNGEAQVSITGPDGEHTVSGAEHLVLRHKGPGATFVVKNSGQGSAYINLAASGIPREASATASAQGIALQRQVLAQDGTPMKEQTFAQGETYVVALEVDAPEELDNLVLVDLLPAGLEVENPRLDATQQADAGNGDDVEDNEGGEEDADGESADANLPGLERPRASTTPSYLDVRDDRLVMAFDRLPSGKHTFRYLVRAVTPGSYQVPGAVVECMYDAKVRAQLAPGRALVTE